MTYKERLEKTREFYPFHRWRESFFPSEDEPEFGGLEQYTQENCDQAQAVFDNLLYKLTELGEMAPENTKVEMFKEAILSLNDLDEEIEGLIETGEREDLCALIDEITIAANLIPSDYGRGEGIADEWRDW